MLIKKNNHEHRRKQKRWLYKGGRIMKQIIKEKSLGRKEKWDRVLNLFKDKGWLDEEGYKTLEEICLCENIDVIFDDNYHGMSEKKQNELLKQVFYLYDEYTARKNNEDNRTIIEPEYMEKYFYKIVVFLVLNKVFEDKYCTVKEMVQKKNLYKRFSSSTNIYDDSYNRSPITDLIVQNVTKGKFYKRVPKDLKNKTKYSYDEEGKLLAEEWYDEQEENWLTEFWFYSEKYILRVGYRHSNGKEIVARIGIQRYEDNYIEESETVFFSNFEGKIDVADELKYGKYEYAEEGLAEAIEGVLYIKKMNNNKTLLHGWHYFFEYDKNGLIEKYKKVEYYNGEIIRENLLGVIQEKKRQDTEKQSYRWKKPNYFNMMTEVK